MAFYTRDALKEQIDAHGWSIGAFTYGAPNVSTWGRDGDLRIGKYCSIGPGVRIFLGGEHRLDWVTTYPFTVTESAVSHVAGHPATRGDVVIGSDVWLASNCLILSGVRIGDGAVIGADAVVSRDVPPFAIVAGNPARIVRMRFRPDQIEALLAIAWWNWTPDVLQPFLPLLVSNDIDAFIRAAREDLPPLGRTSASTPLAPERDSVAPELEFAFSSVIAVADYQRGAFHDAAAQLGTLAQPVGSVSLVSPSLAYTRDKPKWLYPPDTGAAVLRHYAALEASLPQAPPVATAHLDQVLICRNVIYTGSADDRRVLYETFRPNDRPYTEVTAAAALARPDRALDDPDRLCCYLGSVGYGNYGHWLVDDLPRALLAVQAASKPLLWVIPAHSPQLDEVKRQSLSAVLGEATDIVFVRPQDVLTVARLLYVSPVSYHPLLKSPSALQALRQRATAATPSPAGRRLFVTRCGEVRRALNIANAERLVQDHGFQVVDPGVLSFNEQSRLFAEASMVIGVMGAAMANTVFCPPGTLVCHLAPAGWVEPFYWDLAAVMGHRYGCIYGASASPEQAAHLSDFTIDMPALRLTLARMTLDAP